MTMDVASVCDALYDLVDPSDYATIARLSTQAEAALAESDVLIDSLENALATSDGSPRLARWLFVEKVSRQHSVFTDAIRLRLLRWAMNSSFSPSSPHWSDFVSVLQSMKLTFGVPIVNLILMQLNPQAQNAATASTGGVPAATAARLESKALILHTHQVRQVGAFVTKQTNNERTGADKTALQVRTIDSHAAMSMASAYAPLRPAEIQVALPDADADAPQGFMQAVPDDVKRDYEQTRKKRFREIMEKNRERDEEEERSRRHRNRQGEASLGDGRGPAVRVVDDYSDIVIPEDLPRDEYGVKRGNFPRGVRFIRQAIEQCGGCVELDVLVQRLSTLSDKEAVAEFGDVREFILLHRPTFKVDEEDGRWVVRLTADRATPPTETSCPLCSRKLLSRNLARHKNSRRCVTAQLALGLAGQLRGPISELAATCKFIIANPLDYDDDDVAHFTSCLDASGSTPRFKLSSPVQFAPVMKAIRVMRDRWLRKRKSPSMRDVEVEAEDGVIVQMFDTLGRNIRRLPIPWIETGDIVDMCCRFCRGVLPPHNPPPRPADPRINLENKFAGFLLCESEEDDDDLASNDEEMFSDEEGESFVFAPPVTLAESLMAAGFPRDTKKLSHRMRTAPPMVLTRILKSDRSQTVQQMYASAAAEGQQQQQHTASGNSFQSTGVVDSATSTLLLPGDRANSRTFTF